MPLKQDKQGRKDKVWAQIQRCGNEYKRCLFVNVDNVTSKQICIMRKALRAVDACMVMGKNVSRHDILLTLFLDPHEIRRPGAY